MALANKLVRDPQFPFDGRGHQAGDEQRAPVVTSRFARQAVVARLTKRERDARARYLVNEHVGYVARVLRRLGTHTMDIEDAIQRTFITVCERLERIRPGCEKRFLFKVAVGVALHARRSIARRSKVIVPTQEELIEMIVTPEQQTDEVQMRELLDAVLGKLSFELRSVLVLHEFEGMTMTQIANLLGIARGTVASRLRRARAQSRSRLSELSRG